MRIRIFFNKVNLRKTEIFYVQRERIMPVVNHKIVSISLIFAILAGLSLLIPHETGLRGPFVFGGFIVAVLSFFKSAKS